MNYDFGELCTRCVREILPVASAKGLGCSFDVRGPQILPCGDASAMRRGLHRLLCEKDALRDAEVRDVRATWNLVHAERKRRE